MNWIFLAPMAFALIHVFEEFVFPGGFRAWYSAYRPEIAASLTTRFLVTINLILIAVSALVAYEGPQNGKETWLIVVAILFWNAIFHIRGTIRTKRYSPGLASAVLLYLPLGTLGTYEILLHGNVTFVEAVLCLGAGSLYHVFSLSRHRSVAKKN